MRSVLSAGVRLIGVYALYSGFSSLLLFLADAVSRGNIEAFIMLPISYLYAGEAVIGIIFSFWPNLLVNRFKIEDEFGPKIYISDEALLRVGLITISFYLLLDNLFGAYYDVMHLMSGISGTRFNFVLDALRDFVRFAIYLAPIYVILASGRISRFLLNLDYRAVEQKKEIE